MPEREDWLQLAAGNFEEFRLRVGGLVENPVEWSIEDLRALGKDEFITMHHCIQGWSGIAQWGGLSIKKLIEHVKPKPSARVIAFHSFGGHSMEERITTRRTSTARSSRSVCSPTR